MSLAVFLQVANQENTHVDASSSEAAPDRVIESAGSIGDSSHGKFRHDGDECTCKDATRQGQEAQYLSRTVTKAFELIGISLC